jgi:hypothetical protein
MTKTAIPRRVEAVVRREAGLGAKDSVFIDINGGMAGGGLTVRVDIPIGHCADDVAVELSRGDGWHTPNGLGSTAGKER